MANLTNSGKLITKIESIDSSISSINDKIWSIPAGTDIGQEITDIKDSIGTLPEGKTAAQAIADVDSKADGSFIKELLLHRLTFQLLETKQETFIM